MRLDLKRGVEMRSPKIFIHLLPGGCMPQRQTEGAIGYDVRIRAVVSSFEMDPGYPKLRKTLFDFKNMPGDPLIASRVFMLPKKGGVETELVYRMEPEESVLVGIGYITEMPFPLFYWVAPRSGLAARWGITVTNAPGTVDPDYRGEAGVIVYNRNKKPFDLKHGMRIAQIIFQWAVIPEIALASKYEDLQDTHRSAGGFGSTGIQ
jgi:dUTP pyrophosphatase